MPLRSGTRWLPHLARGIESLLRTYPCYDVHLSNASHGNAKAEGLMKIMCSKEVMAYMLLLQVGIVPSMFSCAQTLYKQIVI